MIKRILTYSPTDSQLLDSDIEFAMNNSKGVLWIDIIEPTIDELNRLQRVFNFHSLTIEDCLEANQRPKLEEYPDYLFVILTGVRKLPNQDELEPYQIAIYIGTGFVITIREKSGGISLKSVHNRILLKTRRILLQKAGFLSFNIIDTFIDGYLDLLEELEDEIERIEEIVVQRPKRDLLDKTFDLRTNILIIMKAIRPQRVVMRELALDPMPLLSEATQTYFTDVYDHIMEANDLTASYRDRMSSIVEVYLSSASNKMNDTMRLLAVLTAIITIPNLLASIGGVNFNDFPEIFLRAPFWIFLGTLIVIMVIISLMVRKMDL
jgi:magnesium transporter